MLNTVSAYPLERKDVAEVSCFLKQNDFDVSEASLVHRCFHNPCHGTERDSFFRGSVLRDGTRVIGFIASAIRDGFWCQTPLVISIHGCLCVEERYRDYLATCYMPILKQSGVDVHLANTANSNGQRTFKAMRAVSGDPTNTAIRYRVFSWPAFVNFAMSKHRLLRRVPSFCGTLPAKLVLNPWNRFKYPIPKKQTDTRSERLWGFDEDLFGPFWDEMLAKNQGMLLSRSVEILRWLFQERIDGEENILLAKFDGKRLVGYVVLRRYGNNKQRWMIIDWVAENQHKGILNDLICDACRYLQSQGGMILETIGFPSRVLSILEKALPLSRPIDGNVALMIVKDRTLRGKIQKDQLGWFWGPYDGDRVGY